MECRRNAAQSVVLRADIGMAFQAHIADFMPRQHFRIGGSVRYVARRAAFEPHRGVLEREGSALIAVAIGASSVARHRLAMRIMAIGTGHGALGNFVVVGLLKFCLLRHVAPGAEVVDRGFCADVCPLRVYRVAGYATDLIFTVTALNAAAVGRLVQMAGEAVLVYLGGAQFRGLPDVAGRSGFLVLRARAVTGFAGFHFVVVLFKRLRDVFVAGGTNLVRRIVRSRNRGLGGEKK